MKKSNFNKTVAVVAALAVIGLFFAVGVGFYPFGSTATPKTTGGVAAVNPVAGATTNQTATALSAIDARVGGGKAVTADSTVTFKYLGRFTDGKVFDASDLHGGSLTADLRGAGLIKGFVDGIVGMKVGGQRRIIIPPNLGYGSQEIKDQNGNVIIPANSTLIFDIEVVNVK